MRGNVPQRVNLPSYLRSYLSSEEKRKSSFRRGLLAGWLCRATRRTSWAVRYQGRLHTGLHRILKSGFQAPSRRPPRPTPPWSPAIGFNFRRAPVDRRASGHVLLFTARTFYPQFQMRRGFRPQALATRRFYTGKPVLKNWNWTNCNFLKCGFFRAESRNRLSATRNYRYFGWGGDVTAACTVHSFAKCGNDRHMASYSNGRR
jgi:hypothetical protein